MLDFGRTALCESRRHLAQHVARSLRVGPKRENSRLSARKPRAGDHFHGARDLLRALDAPDALADGLEARH